MNSYYCFMKFSIILALAILVGFISKAQLSEKLDSSIFFKSIKFGQTIPKDFFRNCYGIEAYQTEFRLIYDSIDAECKNKYADLFDFHSTSFSGISIRLNEKGQFYYISLWQLLGATDSINIENIKYPPPIAALYDSIVLVFGKPSQIMDNSLPESVNITGLERTIMWEGYHSSLWLYVLFGPGSSYHSMRIDIAARNFEDIPENVEEE